jgi:hypothetical protein
MGQMARKMDGGSQERLGQAWAGNELLLHWAIMTYQGTRHCAATEGNNFKKRELNKYSINLKI